MCRLRSLFQATSAVLVAAMLTCATGAPRSTDRADPVSAVASSGFTAKELQSLATLGPWPPPLRRDPSNHVSGQPKAIELGRLLFGDARMSPVGYIGCVTCHQPDRAFTDLKPRAHGLADLPRNTPALANLAGQRWYGWGGASDSLWMASIRPILDAREFDGSAASVVRVFERDAALASCYQRVFKASPLKEASLTLVNVGKALAAFQETLVTGRTAFDEVRDAVLRGDAAATRHYPPAALRGLRLFIGPAGCIACHRGPALTDGEFHAGVDSDNDSDDSGRLEDARRLLADPLNLLGQHNDDPRRSTSAATRALAMSDALRGQIRTPGLRNVAVTAPYLHDGQVEHLALAAQHQVPAGFRPAAPLGPGEVRDLTAFLLTLTDAHGARRPWLARSADSPADCR